MRHSDLTKDHLLRYLTGTICPGCQAEKPEYQWTCLDCQRRFADSPDHKALSDICDEHIRAASIYLGYVRAKLAAAER